MLKCKDCKYKEKDSCHGHGEYFGVCKLLYRLCEAYYKDKNDNLNISSFISVCWDSDECKILSKFSPKNK